MSIFDAPVTCPTEAAAARLRRGGYRDVTVRPSRGDKRARPTSASGASQQPMMGGEVRTLFAAHEGERLGRAWHHDAFLLAKHLGINVSRLPLADLQRPEKADSTIYGVLERLPGRTPQVGLADGVGGHAEMWILAHEIGHNQGCESEDDADRFAASFMCIHDDEYPTPAAARWRAIQKELEQRACAQRTVFGRPV